MRVSQTSIPHRGVNRAIDLIQADPAAALDLDDIADAACLSKYHFSRVFRKLAGETPVSFLWRTRLERSAYAFDQGVTASVTEAALTYGFSSPEAYSRAFSRIIGVPPRYFLAANDPQMPRVAPEIHERSFEHGGLRMDALEPPRMSSVTVERLPETRVAYVRRRGAYNYYGTDHGQIRDSFRRLVFAVRNYRILKPDALAIGIPWNSPRLTRPEHCLYDACVEVNCSFSRLKGIEMKTIPGGRYAVLRVRCAQTQVAAYWNWFTFVWLPQSGEVLDSGFSLERVEAAAVLSEDTALDFEFCVRLAT